MEIVVLVATDQGAPLRQLEPAGFHLDEAWMRTAESVYASARNGAAHREGAFLPLGAGEDIIGVMVLSPAASLPEPGGEEDLELQAIASQAALAIKRSMLEEKARAADRQQ